VLVHPNGGAGAYIMATGFTQLDRQSDELVLDADELVPLQRPDGFGVQRRERTR
jgi:hypothetical protein